MGEWKKIGKRGRFKVNCNQNEMDFLGGSGWADTQRGAKAIKRQKQRNFPSLTFSVDKQNPPFWARKVK